MWQSWVGWKMPLCKWHIFWMAPWMIYYFVVMLFYIERKWFLMRNLAIILPFKSKMSGQFLRFNAIDVSKYWKIVEFRKTSIKMKNCKTFYETQTASRLKEIIQAPPPHTSRSTSCYIFETKIFLERYTEIYRHLFSKCFKKVVLGRQEMVQCKCFFWHQTETFLLENL